LEEEEGGKNDFARRMAMVADKEASHHLLRKWMHDWEKEKQEEEQVLALVCAAFLSYLLFVHYLNSLHGCLVDTRRRPRPRL